MDLTDLVAAIVSLNGDDAFRPQLNAEQWRGLAPFLTQRDLRSGEPLIRDGDRDRTLYMLERGSLHVFVNALGRPGRVAVLRPGAITGELGLFLDAPRSANVEAALPSVVWGLRQLRLEELAQRMPVVAFELVRAAGAVMAVRLRANGTPPLPQP